MGVYNLKQYRSFDLSSDFAQYNQAVWLIAHGHINPWSSIGSFPFNDNYFSLVTYPLAVVYWIYPHGVVLFWLQDAAGVVAELVAVVWIMEIAQRLTRSHEKGRVVVVLALGSVLLMLANPWFYRAMFFGVHPEAFAAVFLVLAIRSAWKGQVGWSIAWAVMLLLAGGDLGGLYLAGFGLTLLLALPRRWWWGLGGIVVGIAWIRITQALGVSQNTILSGYSYIVSANAQANPNVSMQSLLRGLLLHPTRWIPVLWDRRTLLYENLIPTGVIGLFSAWSVGTIVVVLLGSALILPLVFIESGFQNFTIYVVGVGGTAIVLCRLFSSRRVGVRGSAILMAGVIAVQALVFGLVEIPRVPSQWIEISEPKTQVLQRGLDRTPADAEVIADSGVIGRFSARPWVYNFYPLPLSIPLHSKDVEFIVITDQSVANEPLSASAANSVISYLHEKLHVSTVSSGHGVYVFSWHPKKGEAAVTIP